MLLVALGMKPADTRDYVLGCLSLLKREADQSVPDISVESVFVMGNNTTMLGAGSCKSVEAV